MTRSSRLLANPMFLGVSLYILLLAVGEQFYRIMMASPVDVLELAEMEFQEVENFEQSASDHDKLEPRTLPDDWKHRNHTASSGIYYKTLPLNVSPNRLWAVYLPIVNMNVAVYLNGSLLGSGGQFRDPLPRNFNRPQHYSIPNGMLRTGDNLLEIRVQAGESMEGLLGRVYLGPQELLLDSFQRRYFVRVTLVLGITVTMVFLGLLLGGLWLYRRKESIYGWMAFLSLIWAVHNLNLLVVDIPLSTRIWNWLVHATLGWFVIAMVFASHRIIEIRPLSFERSMLWGGAALTLLLGVLLHTTNWYPVLKPLWNSLFASLGIYPVLRLTHAYWRQQNAELPIMVTAGLVILSFGFHDWMLELGLWPRTGGYIIQYSSPVLLFIFSGIVLARFVRSLNDKDKLNRDLERRIAAKTRELQHNLQRLHELEKENALNEERERIMRDIHDGVGGNLVSALALMEASHPDPDKLRNTLKDGLTNLRLIIDSLDPVENDLTTVLGLWRTRVQPVLEANHMRFEWQVSDLPEMDHLGPGRVLHILCILQETMTNILKHAQATVVTVQTRQSGDQVIVEVSDNGIGFSGSSKAGRGLGNMRHRARSLNADISIIPSDHGTTMHLALPIVLQ